MRPEGLGRPGNVLEALRQRESARRRPVGLALCQNQPSRALPTNSCNFTWRKSEISAIRFPFAGSNPRLARRPWAKKRREDFSYFFRHGTLTRADLAGEAFLFREIGSGTRSLFDEFIGDIRINTVQMSMELDLNETIKQAVRAGHGDRAHFERIWSPSRSQVDGWFASTLKSCRSAASGM